MHKTNRELVLDFNAIYQQCQGNIFHFLGVFGFAYTIVPSPLSSIIKCRVSPEAILFFSCDPLKNVLRSFSYSEQLVSQGYNFYDDGFTDWRVFAIPQ